MASDDTMTILSSTHEDEDDADYYEDDHHHHHHNLSRLSMCTSNSKHSMYGYDDDDDGGDDVLDDDTMMHMSGLSIDDGSDIEADAELSDGKMGSEDSDKETMGWSSLPATSQGRIPSRRGLHMEPKEYASETEERGQGRRGWTTKRKAGRMVRERWLERAWEMRKCRAMDEEMDSGDSECTVMARLKGGGRCLSMDLEEVKACRDLGFQLQNDWTLEIPCKICGSTIDSTDSGGNSPIANWRISSPGDDPRDVKARLKMWAQAVVLASASRLNP